MGDSGAHDGGGGCTSDFRLFKLACSAIHMNAFVAEREIYTSSSVGVRRMCGLPGNYFLMAFVQHNKCYCHPWGMLPLRACLSFVAASNTVDSFIIAKSAIQIGM